jgi:hypothetical protein
MGSALVLAEQVTQRLVRSEKLEEELATCDRIIVGLLSRLSANDLTKWRQRKQIRRMVQLVAKRNRDLEIAQEVIRVQREELDERRRIEGDRLTHRE